MTETNKPRSRRRTPKASETPGERLKRAILSKYELDPAERLLLDQAAELADVLARLNQQVAAETELTQRGAKGNRVVTPLLLAQRRHSEVLVRVLEGLALRAADEEEGESVTTKLARKAAQARWARERGA